MAQLTSKEWRKNRERRILAAGGGAETVMSEMEDEEREREEEEGEDEEEEEGDVGDVAAVGVGRAPLPPQATRPVPPRAPNLGAKPRTRGPDKRPGARPPRKEWSTHDAEDLWPEVITYAQQGLGKTAGDIDIRVTRMDPGPRTPLTTIRGGLVASTAQRTAGENLIEYIDRQVHMPTAKGEASTYEVAFYRRWDGIRITSGHLHRPSAMDLTTMRTAGSSGGAPTPQAQALQGMGQPQQWGPPPWWAGQAPPAAPTGPDPRDAIIQQMFDFIKAQGLQPPVGMAAPPPVPAQPTAPPSWWTQPPPWWQPPTTQGVQAPPPVSAADLRRERLNNARQMVEEFREMQQLHDDLGRLMGRNTDDTGVGDPADTTEGAPASPPDPNADLPYTLHDIPGADSGALVSRFARDKKTGEIDLKYTAVNNPELLKKGLGLAEKFGERMQEFFKQATSAAAGAPQRVEVGVGQSNVPTTPPKELPPNGTGQGTDWQS